MVASLKAAQELLDDGRNQDALAIYTEIIDSSDEHSADIVAAVYAHRAKFFSAHHPEKELANCEQALKYSEIDTESKVTALIAKVDVLRQQGQFEKAFVVLSDLKMLMESPAVSGALEAKIILCLSRYLFETDQIDSALQNVARLIAIEEAEPDTVAEAHLLNYYIYNLLGEAAAATREIEAMTALNGISMRTRADAYIGAAWLLEHDNKTDAATEKLQSFLSDFDVPANLRANIYYALAFIESNTGDWDAEMERYRTITLLDGVEPDKLAEAYLNMGHVHDRLMEADTTLSMYTQALEVRNLSDTGKSLAYNTRANYYNKLREYAIAIEDSSHVLDLTDLTHDEANTALTNRGIAYSELERWDESEADFRRIITENSIGSNWHADTLFNLACLYARQSRALDAVSVLTERAGIFNQDVQKLTRTDLNEPNFENIRNDDGFRAFRLKLESAWMQEG